MIPIRYNLRSLAVRKTTTLATGLGIALVVLVLASALMLSSGIRRTLAASGQPDVAIVMRKGSDNELSSVLEDPELALLRSAPGVKKDDKGEALMVGESIVVAAMQKVGTGGISNMQIRGVPDNVLKFRPEVHIVEGRPMQPGTDEVIVGKRILGRFKGLDLNSSFEIRKGRPVKVVGVFESGGSSYESEVWASLDVLRTSYRREGTVSSARVRLDSPAKYDSFKAAIELDKRIGLMAMRETEYYEKQSEASSKFIGALGTVIAVFFSIGAMIGATITMNAAVANRTREIGTLRALGFPRRQILASFLIESVVLALGGGIVGTLASLGMGFVKFSMVNFASWSEIVFSFDPTPRILITSVLFAVVMGVMGGFLPAVRAARIAPVTAMRG